MRSNVSPILLVVLLMAIVSCGLFSESENDPLIDEDLLDVVWKLDSLQTPAGKDIPSPCFPTALQFTTEMDIRMDGPCSRFEGTYEIGKSQTLGIGPLDSTQVAYRCFEVEQDFEAVLANALEHMEQYEVQTDRLTLTNSLGDYVMDFSVEVHDTALWNILWRLDTLQTPTELIVIIPEEESYTGGRHVTIVFQDNERDEWWAIGPHTKWRVAGSGFCDLYYGAHDLRAASSMRIGCLDRTAQTGGCRFQDAHEAYFAALESIDAYDRGEHRLVLYDHDQQYRLSYSLQIVDEELIDVLRQRWQLDSLRTTEVTIVPAPDTSNSIELGLDLIAPIRGSCGVYRGLFSNLEKGTLEIDMITATISWSCSARQEAEDAMLLEAVKTIQYYAISDSRLTLSDSNQDYVFYFHRR
ncbi:MAG: META domain-containing protein [Fidelibacterota bacterium]|nr:MAG: META domain-containing protein [Candidatus Neomarinimicrobiota bacterium]